VASKFVLEERLFRGFGIFQLDIEIDECLHNLFVDFCPISMTLALDDIDENFLR